MNHFMMMIQYYYWMRFLLLQELHSLTPKSCLLLCRRSVQQCKGVSICGEIELHDKWAVALVNPLIFSTPIQMSFADFRGTSQTFSFIMPCNWIKDFQKFCFYWWICADVYSWSFINFLCFLFKKIILIFSTQFITRFLLIRPLRVSFTIPAFGQIWSVFYCDW